MRARFVNVNAVHSVLPSAGAQRVFRVTLTALFFKRYNSSVILIIDEFFNFIGLQYVH